MRSKGGQRFPGGGHTPSGGKSTGTAVAAGFMSGSFGRSCQPSLYQRHAVKNATGVVSGGGLGGMRFASSVSKGGDFANRVIGSVAKGSIQHDGSMTGANAEAALLSYMGYAGMDGEDIPHYSECTRSAAAIMGTETTTDY